LGEVLGDAEVSLPPLFKEILSKFINSSTSFPCPFTDLVRGFIRVVISRLVKPLTVGLVLLVARWVLNRTSVKHYCSPRHEKL